MEGESVRGFIVHAYLDARRKRVNVIGRLEDGRSFAAVFPEPERPLCVAARDGVRALDLLSSARSSASLIPTHLVSFDGSPCLAIVAPNERAREGSVGILARGDIRVLGRGYKGASLFLISRGIRAGIRITGNGRPGHGVDVVFTDCTIVPDHGARAPITVLSLDIETEEPSGKIRAIGLFMDRPREGVLLFAGKWTAPSIPDENIEVFESEKDLLVAFSDRMRSLDPDVITGWNVIDFDFPRLAAAFERNRLPFALGRSLEAGRFFPAETELAEDSVSVKRSASVFLPGRQVLDGLRLVRTGQDSFDSYALDAVAQAVLGRGKTVAATGVDKLDELNRLYAEDPLTFCRYCLNDAELVLGIIAKKDLLSHTVERAALTGAGIDKAWTSVASFERVYSEGLWQRGVLEPDPDPARAVSGAAGGTVLEPMSGIYRDVAVFDFRSLYPSVIRTFNVDPLAYERATFGASSRDDAIHAPNGALFERVPGILPSLIEEYFTERLSAIERGDDAAAYVYKILMNSFYGVLGAQNCRYARTELAGAITSFGKTCLHFARDWFVSRGFRVLYGDTDSVFVELTQTIGEIDTIASCGALATVLNADLAARVREEWGLESFISIRFEKLYSRFFIPRLRSPAQSVHAKAGGLESSADDRGRAKGYAGCIREAGSERVEIKGMEAARSDYTPLAREFQRELLALVFQDASPETLGQFVRERIVRLFRGEYDESLVYRKKVRRDPDSYVASTPPHIKVARQLGWKKRHGTVEYLMTVNGPEALSLRHSPIDYAWYAASQILPIARSAGQAAGFDADAIVGRLHADGQLELDL